MSTVAENVVLAEDRAVDLTATGIMENTRGACPIEFTSAPRSTPRSLMTMAVAGDHEPAS